MVDTPGFGDFVNNEDRYDLIHCHASGSNMLMRDSWNPILQSIESRFDSYLEQENRVNRQKIVDNRVHACLYFIQPTGHSYVLSISASCRQC